MESRLARASNLAWIAFAVAVGAFLRFHRIGDQSLWFDDYNDYVCVLEPTFREYWNCLFGVGSFNGEQVPFYYLFPYFWSRLFGTSPEALRALPILFGLATIPVVYLLARDAFGRTAGAVAALCLAMSPVHIFYSQEMRHYSLVALLGALSIYALLIACRDNRPWAWALHGLCNVLLIWTHLLGAFLLVGQGVYLLSTARTSFRRMAFWFVFHGLAVIPSALYAIFVLHTTATAYDFFIPPDIKSVFLDIVAEDAVNVSGALLPETTALDALAVDPWLGYLLVAAFTLCMAWALWKAAARIRSGGDDPVRLFLCVAAIPVLALAALSLLWRPCIFPRYTIYSSIVVYALAGGAMAALPRRSIRLAAGVAFFALIGYQLLHTVPHATRTQWKDAAAFVQANIAPGDVVLVGWPGGPAEIARALFRFYFTDKSYPVLQATSAEDTCDAVACLLSKDALVNRVWAVFVMNYYSGPFLEFKSCLWDEGLQFERTTFDAMDCIIVYRIQAQTGQAPVAGPQCETVFSDLVTSALKRGNFTQAAEFLGDAEVCGILNEPPWPEVRAMLHSPQGRSRLAEIFDDVRQGHDYLGRNNLAKAAAAFREARKVGGGLDVAHEDYLGALLQLALGNAEYGDPGEALDAIREADTLDPFTGWLCENLAARLKNEQPAEDSVAAIRLFLVAAGFSGEWDRQLEHLRDAVDLDPEFAPGYAMIGQILLAQGKHEEALQALSTHNRLAAIQYAPVLFLTGRVLLALGRDTEARDAFARCFAADSEEEDAYSAFLKALLMDRDLAKVHVEMQRLESNERCEIFPEFAEAVKRLEAAGATAPAPPSP